MFKKNAVAALDFTDSEWFSTSVMRGDKDAYGSLMWILRSSQVSGLGTGLDVFNLSALVTLLKALRSPAASRRF